jgi:hypothetical protein
MKRKIQLTQPIGNWTDPDTGAFVLNDTPKVVDDSWHVRHALQMGRLKELPYTEEIVDPEPPEAQPDDSTDSLEKAIAKDKQKRKSKTPKSK